jgi:hypothetical protein
MSLTIRIIGYGLYKDTLKLYWATLTVIYKKVMLSLQPHGPSTLALLSDCS